MKTSEILSSSNLRTLRNGKTVSPGKIVMRKKKSMLKIKNVEQLVHPKISQSDLSILHVENKNNFNASVCDLLGIRELYILLENVSWPVINNEKNTLHDQNNNKRYKNSEDCNQFNEFQFFNEQEQKKETKSELVNTKTFLPTAISPSNLIKKNGIQTGTKTNSAINKYTDVRITRGMTTKLKIEEREQLNQKLINKFPDITFNKCFVKLDDISEKAKFLKTLGLTCRFKSSLTTLKLKRIP